MNRVAEVEDETKRRLLTVALLDDQLEGDSIVVGGSAVMVYVDSYYSVDVDILPVDMKTKEALRALDFEQTGQGTFFSERLDVKMHLNRPPLKGSRERLTEVEVEAPWGVKVSVEVIGLEDLIVDRLLGCKFWDYGPYCEQAITLFETYRQEVDEEYLRERSEEEDCADVLDDLLF